MTRQKTRQGMGERLAMTVLCEKRNLAESRAVAAVGDGCRRTMAIGRQNTHRNEVVGYDKEFRYTAPTGPNTRFDGIWRNERR